MDMKQLLLAAALAAGSSAAWPADLRPSGAFIYGGVAERQSYSVTAGVYWPWEWRREFGRSELSGLTEAFVSHWSARIPGGRHSLTQAGLLPLLRIRAQRGRSDWFFEAGIGVSLMDHAYHTRTKEFGSAFNFVDVLGVGRSFGSDRRHELGLRLTHVSNGSIKKPNPGENFLQLRYAVSF
jgi:lipid A 3-O-deacylase